MSPLPYLLFVILLLAIVHPFGAEPRLGTNDKNETVTYLDPEDDPIEYGIEQLDKIIKIYNFTESLEKRYERLRAMDPYGVANRLVEAVTEKIKAMTQHYNDVRKLLARESTRGPGKRQYDNLYHQAALLHQEIKEAEEHVAVAQDRKRTDLAEEAIKIQESLRADIVNITKEQMREELQISIMELAHLKLFPKSVTEFEKDEKLPRNTLPFIDRPALDNFYNLFKQAADLAQQIEDAFFGDDDDDETSDMDYVDFAREMLIPLDEKLTQLTATEIPNYVKKHQHPLSRILLITLERLVQLEIAVKKLDIESSLLGAQDKVIEKVYLELAAASNDYNRAIVGAEKIYQKYYDIEALKQSEPPAQMPPMDRDEL